MFSLCFDRKLIKRCKWFGLSWIHEVRYLTTLIGNYLEKNRQIHLVKSVLICHSDRALKLQHRKIVSERKRGKKSRELSLALDWITFPRLFMIKHRNYNKHTFLFSSHCLPLWTIRILTLPNPSTNPLFRLEYVKTRPQARLLTALGSKKLYLKGVVVGKDRFSCALALVLHAFSVARASLALSKKKQVGKTNHLWTVVKASVLFSVQKVQANYKLRTALLVQEGLPRRIWRVHSSEREDSTYLNKVYWPTKQKTSVPWRKHRTTGLFVSVDMW